MHRADRLFQVVQLIRGRRLTTAHWLAERLGLSERTIYRDIAQLQAQGVPIEGEAGVGYRLGKGFDLPPLMFTLDEARALLVRGGLRASEVAIRVGFDSPEHFAREFKRRFGVSATEYQSQKAR